MQQLLEKRKKELIAICQALNIKRLAENLSVDEYTKNYFTLHYKLRELFNREIDIVTERTLSNPYFIESINESKQLIYEA